MFFRRAATGIPLNHAVFLISYERIVMLDNIKSDDDSHQHRFLIKGNYPMRKISGGRVLFGLSLLAAAGFAPAAQARDTEYQLNIADVMNSPDYSTKVGNDVAFYFAGQPTPPVVQSLGEFSTNRKTNSVGKADETACRWAMLSALLELHKRALRQGGNAVVNVISDYKRIAGGTETTYECHAGNIIVGVALKGMVVKLAH
jgi:uncharacterized protein YbjQ (UPF0145 family)